MLRYLHLIEKRDRLLENILNIMDVNEYVDFENQTIEKTVCNFIRVYKQYKF